MTQRSTEVKYGESIPQDVLWQYLLQHGWAWEIERQGKATGHKGHPA